jgi:predicted MFS family arabinose efflux permease
LATWKTLLRQRTVVAILLTGFLLSAAIEVPFIVYGAWLELAFGLSLSALGLASIVVGLAEATAEMGTSLLSDRPGKRQSVIMGLVGLAGSLLLLPALSSHGLLAALVGVALMILAFEFALVSLLPITTEVVPGARASVLGLNITAQSLGHALGALAGGWLWRWENIAVQGAVGAACALLAVLVLLRGVQDGA